MLAWLESGEKHCSGCDRTLPLESFRRIPSEPSGFQGYCRACVNAGARAHRRRAKNELQQCETCHQRYPAEDFRGSQNRPVKNCKSCRESWAQRGAPAKPGRCPACLEWKPATEFQDARSRRTLRCRDCLAAVVRVPVGDDGEADDYAREPADPEAAAAAIRWRLTPPDPPALACCLGSTEHDYACPMRRLRPEVLLR
jgi:hypothetical protein